MNSEEALKKMESACSFVVKGLPVVSASDTDGSCGLNSEQYSELLTNAVKEQFTDGCAALLEHPVHWALMDCGMKYEATSGPNGDISRVYIPKGDEIKPEAMGVALREYEETIMARLEMPQE